MALLEPPQDLLKLLRESLPEEIGTKPVNEDDGSEEILAYVAFIAAGLTEANEYDASVWTQFLQATSTTNASAGTGIGIGGDEWNWEKYGVENIGRENETKFRTP